MSLEVRQLVLRASVQEDDDEDEDAEKETTCGGAEADACEDKETLKEEILAACRKLLREELRAIRER
jgi:Family of unknown function (DUF5908)